MNADTIAWQHSYILLSEANQIVALNLNTRDDENRLLTIYTAVDPDFRGQNLGFALKLKLLTGAWVSGIPFLLAENDEQNVAMLRINKRLGFRQVLTLGIYQKTLDL